eukprot:12880711-Prorocentrum_lima.AAC.1
MTSIPTTAQTFALLANQISECLPSTPHSPILPTRSRSPSESPRPLEIAPPTPIHNTIEVHQSRQR